MDSLELKKVTFIHNNDRNTMIVGPTMALEKLTDRIKARFDIKPDGNVGFIEVTTQMELMPGMVSDFWKVTTDEVPVYRIDVRKSDLGREEKPGWCESFVVKYILPLMSE